MPVSKEDGSLRGNNAFDAFCNALTLFGTTYITGFGVNCPKIATRNKACLYVKIKACAFHLASSISSFR